MRQSTQLLLDSVHLLTRGFCLPYHHSEYMPVTLVDGVRLGKSHELVPTMQKAQEVDLNSYGDWVSG